MVFLRDPTIMESQHQPRRYPVDSTRRPADPAQGAFDDPTFRQNHKAAQVRAFNDLQRPRPCPRDQVGHLRPGVTAVADDALDEGEAPPGLTQQRLPAIAVLDVGGVDVHIQQQAERVDEDVPLSPKDLLTRVIAGRIKRASPFRAPRALCASMIAVVGLASRPAASRLWT